MKSNNPKIKINKLINAILYTEKKFDKNVSYFALVYMILYNDLSFFSTSEDVILDVENIEEYKEEVYKKYIFLVLSSDINDKSDYLEKKIKDIQYKYKKAYSDYLEEKTKDIQNEYKKAYSDYIEQKILEYIKSCLNYSSKDDKNNENGKSLNNYVARMIAKRVNNDVLYRSKVMGEKFEKSSGINNINNRLIATSDKGKYMENQEDASLIIEKVNIPGFEMVAVADGMGGLEEGEYASNKAIFELKRWFENIEESYYQDISGIKERLENFLVKLSKEICDEKNGESGTTIALSIRGKNKTLIANVGDSRIYSYSDNNLKQLTYDHTYLNFLNERGSIDENTFPKKIRRFHKNSNWLYTNLGTKNELTINITEIDNKDYDFLLHFTDGVTDCLEDSEIAISIDSCIKRGISKNEIPEIILKIALEKDSCLPDKYKGLDEFFEMIPGGKDNTTVAVLNNKKIPNTRE